MQIKFKKKKKKKKKKHRTTEKWVSDLLMTRILVQKGDRFDPTAETLIQTPLAKFD